MCNRIHIYLVDEESLRWLIVNEYIGERFANDKYTGRFIITDWTETESKIYVKFIGFDGRNNAFSIDKNRKLRISRKLKLESIESDKIDNDFYTHKERLAINKLRFEKLKSTCQKNRDLKYSYSTTSNFYWNKAKPSRKSIRTIKRKKLAKENRSNNKAKNR